MGVGGAGQGAYHGRQVEVQHPLVLGACQGVGPETRLLGVGLHQPDLVVITAGEFEVVEGLLVDEEHGRGGAILRRHVGDGGPIAEGEGGGALAMELQVGADHLLLAQELGERQHQIRGGDAGLGLAGELDADDRRQPHPGGAPQHHVLRFEAPHPHSDDAEGIHVGGVAVGAHAGIRVGQAAIGVDDGGHLLQVDLVHDAVARRDHLYVLERLLGPVDEVEAILVAAILDGAVLGKGVRVEAAALHGQGVVDDKLHRHHWVHLGGIPPLIGDGIAQASEIHQGGLAQDVVAHHPGREPGEVAIALVVDDLAEALAEDGRIAPAHQVLGMHAGGVGEPVPGAGGDGVHRLPGVEVVKLCAGQGLAILSVYHHLRSLSGTKVRSSGPT
ncbi:hypothetical protein D3C76_947630 [compost metagenome]